MYWYHKVSTYIVILQINHRSSQSNISSQIEKLHIYIIYILLFQTCKCLLPNLLMLIGDKAVQNITKQLEATSYVAAKFIWYLTTLIHLCLTVFYLPDRYTFGTEVICFLCYKIFNHS